MPEFLLPYRISFTLNYHKPSVNSKMTCIILHSCCSPSPQIVLFARTWIFKQFFVSQLRVLCNVSHTHKVRSRRECATSKLALMQNLHFHSRAYRKVPFIHDYRAIIHLYRNPCMRVTRLYYYAIRVCTIVYDRPEDTRGYREERKDRAAIGFSLDAFVG